jgi:hypothetical protein
VTPEQQRAIVEAAIRAVVADHQIARDIETVRAALAAYDDLVDAVCAADPAAAEIVTAALRRRRELEREHRLAVESSLRRAYVEETMKPPLR